LDKLVAELACKLDRLVLDADATKDEGISSDVATGSTAISIGDLPSAAFGFVEGRALGRVKDGVTFAGCRFRSRRWQLSAPDPEVRRAGVEVKGQILRWRADGDGGQIKRVLFNVLGLRYVSATSPAGVGLNIPAHYPFGHCHLSWLVHDHGHGPCHQ
jgi:hypothetical protein